MPKELKTLIDGAGKAGGTVAGAAGDTLGKATRPLGTWEAENPQIVMVSQPFVIAVVRVIANALGGGGGEGGGREQRKPGTYDNGYDASRDAQN
ncbi:hypothetical protein ABZ135_37870 [Streptomyces sp. NPDC006339]|uniref:hypothetical protein n=1 Tax=Streptomyces sp. NPDC006339 TaxID=3156755 RepID=UPI0033ACE9A3